MKSFFMPSRWSLNILRHIRDDHPCKSRGYCLAVDFKGDLLFISQLVI